MPHVRGCGISHAYRDEDYLGCVAMYAGKSFLLTTVGLESFKNLDPPERPYMHNICHILLLLIICKIMEAQFKPFKVEGSEKELRPIGRLYFLHDDFSGAASAAP